MLYVWNKGLGRVETVYTEHGTKREMESLLQIGSDSPKEVWKLQIIIIFLFKSLYFWGTMYVVPTVHCAIHM